MNFFELFTTYKQINNVLPNNKKLIESSLIYKQKKMMETIKTPILTNLLDLSPTQKRWIEKLNIIINDNIHDNSFSIQQLAEEADISERSLHYHIKKLTNMTPAKYINELRLMKAKELLEKQIYRTVSEVCYAVGFKKVSYFSALFKKRFKKPPSTYLQL